MNNFSHMLMHSKGFYDAFENDFKHTPIDNWGYYCFDYHGHYFQIESDKAFFQDLLEKNIHLEIPFSESNSIKYQFYSSIIGADPNTHGKIYHLAKSYEYYSFVNVIYYQKDHTAVITLASKKQSFDMINYILNNEAKILALTTKIHKKLFLLFDKKNSIILPDQLIKKIQQLHQKELIDEKDNILSHLADKDNVRSFDFSILPFDINQSRLTPREKDIIYLLYHGFNTKESADILELSRRTIERSFENIRKKTNCSNKIQILGHLLKQKKQF